MRASRPLGALRGKVRGARGTLVSLLALAALSVASAACSSFDGEVVSKDDQEIRLKVDYDAADGGTDARAVAAKHCDSRGKQAVWYGYDRDGNMHFKCE